MADVTEIIQKANSLSYDTDYLEIEGFLNDKLLEEYNNAELYLLRAWADHNLKKTKSSKINKEKALNLDPDLRNKMNKAGIEYYDKGDYEKAIVEYDKSAFIDKNFSYAYGNKGLAYFQMKLFDQALKEYDQALLLDDKYENNYLNRGLAYEYKRDYDKAIEDYSKALELNPTSSLAYLYRGLVWYYKGDNDNALDDFSKAIEFNNEYAIAYYNRGLTWNNKKNYDNAIKDFDKSIELDPEYSNAFVGKGLALYYKGEYDKAIEEYDKAVSLKSDLSITYLDRGLAFHYKGEYDKAIADFDKAIVLEPDYTNAYINRGIAYYYKTEYNKAIDDYTFAIKLNDKLDFVYNNRGLAYYNKGYYLKAIEDYNKALELNPVNYEAYNNRGMTWFEMDEYDKAIEDCSKTIEISPNYVDAYNIRGNSWYYKENFEKARIDFEKVAGYIGYEAIGNSNVGDVFASMGDFHIAKDYYVQAQSYFNSPEWLEKKINQRMEIVNHKIELLKANIPIKNLIEHTRIEDKIDRTLEKIRKIAKSDTQSVVHYTKLFVGDIYVSSLNSKMHYSNAIYMNDPMEGQVFFEYLNDERINQAYLNGEKRNESSVYLGSFLPAEESVQGKSHEDELVMWRTYGKDVKDKEAAGCNLVISSTFFKQRKKPVEPEELALNVEDQGAMKMAKVKEEYSKSRTGDEELLNVIYIDIHKNERSIKNDPTGNLKPALDELKSLLFKIIELRDNFDVKSDFYRYIENVIFKHLSTITFLFKSADYIFENEVRVIEYVPRNSDLIKYLVVDQPNLPKKRFYIESTNEILPYIMKIHLGPKVENHQQWSLYFDFEIRQRAKELAEMDNPPFSLNPSDIEILKSECKFQ